MVKLGYTILYVNDVEKSMEFYEKSFGFERKFIVPEKSYGELFTGDTTLSFATMEFAYSNLKNGFMESSLSQKPFGIELGFITDDVDAAVQNAIRNGAILLEEPIQKPWGQTVAYLRDINGFLLEICTPDGV